VDKGRAIEGLTRDVGTRSSACAWGTRADGWRGRVDGWGQGVSRLAHSWATIIDRAGPTTQREGERASGRV
jgi:hypothetical protein